METIVSVEVDGKKIELYQSEGDSRDWDNYTKLICFHGRYNLGDKHEYNHNDYDGWDEMEQAILRKEKDVVWISPLYLYDHSGITISTSPFESEIKTYDQELCGEVYGFSIEDSDGEVEDSCGGFYGSDLNENGMGDYLEQEQIDALTNVW